MWQALRKRAISRALSNSCLVYRVKVHAISFVLVPEPSEYLVPFQRYKTSKFCIQGIDISRKRGANAWLPGKHCTPCTRLVHSVLWRHLHICGFEHFRGHVAMAEDACSGSSYSAWRARKLAITCSTVVTTPTMDEPDLSSWPSGWGNYIAHRSSLASIRPPGLEMIEGEAGETKLLM